ncbi:permease prefix domain 1-containing protein [Psychromicrobium xiongbiense]|uniref:permease prefix domain 1-containing protein n=1 Tax=Psychromicrobium xiongbiense TaxID=3051184 RepID=UPI002556C84A|nr:permease prefix domain 1-containing protein [Psychromicrobium sp. YIM S02556]
MPEVGAHDDAIDRYLDELADRLSLRARLSGSEQWRYLQEAQSHLRDSQEGLLAQGWAPEQAAQQAIDRFGAPEVIAAATASSVATALRAYLARLWPMVGLGLVVIGASGLLSVALEALLGPMFYAGDRNGTTYTPARCSDFLGFFPQADSCNVAAALHHSDELISERLMAGILGVLLLTVWLGARLVTRVTHRGGTPRVATTVPVRSQRLLDLSTSALFMIVGALGLAYTAIFTLGPALRGQDIAGVGASLSDGVVALAVGLVLAVVFLRRYRLLRARSVRHP